MQHLIGKKLLVKAHIGRDDRGKRTGKIIEVSGTCSFIGPNEILGVPLMVVLDRMPIEVKHINDVKVL